MMSLYVYNSSSLSFRRDLDEHPNPKSFFMHAHRRAELYCFLRGKGSYHVEGTVYPLQSGDILIMRPGEAHYIEISPDEPYERMSLIFDADLFSGLDPGGELMKRYFNRPAGKGNLYRLAGCTDDTLLRHMEQLSHHPEPDRIFLLSHLFATLEMLRSFNEEVIEEDDVDVAGTQEYRIIRYINDHLTESLSLDLLCSECFISKSQLCRLFKKATASTVWEYITVKRLLLAQRLITDGEKPSDVYSACGFKDYSSFYRAYKRHFGLPPKRRTKE